MSQGSLLALARRGAELLIQDDPALATLLEREYQRQASTLALVASSSIVDPSVLACQASVPVNVTAEGYPGRRFHAGCQVIDEIEQLALERARAAFKARYANVQPHSASSANEIVMLSLLKPGDTILGMDLQHGGHLTHGSKASISGQYFNAQGYGLNHEGFIDFDQVEQLADEFKPRLIICGATAYPRVVDFRRFRQIADRVGALLLADISHTAGLVIAGLHPSPIDEAHVTTTCTHKQLFGPRGGLILMGRDCDSPGPDGRRTLSELMQSAVFPLVQGAPALNVIAAKARALARSLTPEFADLAGRIVANGRALAQQFVDRGYRVVSGGSDNHIVLLDLSDRAMTGVVAERALEDSHIIVNKNKVPGDAKPSTITSGVRLGTNSVALRCMGPDVMKDCAQVVDAVLSSVQAAGDYEYVLPIAARDDARTAVGDLCRRFPIPRYPAIDAAQLA